MIMLLERDADRIESLLTFVTQGLVPAFHDIAEARQCLERLALARRGYPDGGLPNETGSDPERRQEEAMDLCAKLQPYFLDLSDKEQGFVEQMADAEYVSPKQLLWLRDIWSRYS